MRDDGDFVDPQASMLPPDFFDDELPVECTDVQIVSSCVFVIVGVCNNYWVLAQSPIQHTPKYVVPSGG